MDRLIFRDDRTGVSIFYKNGYETYACNDIICFHANQNIKNQATLEFIYYVTCL